MSEVRCMYDFQGGHGELSFYEGDLISVIEWDIGDGWGEGTLNGVRGVFPLNYIEEVSGKATNGGWNGHGYGGYNENGSGYAYDGDDWDDGRDAYGDDDGDINSRSHSLNSAGAPDGSTATMRGGGSGLKKNLTSRFTVFSKSGAENFLIGNTTSTVPPSTEIVALEPGPFWASMDFASVEVREPHKDSKLKGLKTFIAYEIVDSRTGTHVTRRYKHFDWLNSQLTSKFTMLYIPPLPEKSMTGRYEDEFIEKRRAGLERWLNRIARHSALFNSFVFQHFLTCTDDSRWKTGKRTAEKSEWCGANMFCAFDHPDEAIVGAEETVADFVKFSKALTSGVSSAISHSERFSSATKNVIANEFKKLSGVFFKLSSADADGNPILPPNVADKCAPMHEALMRTSFAYDAMSAMWAKQSQTDILPLVENLKEYAGILGSQPPYVDIHGSTYHKIEETRKLVDQGKLSEEELQKLSIRADTVSNVTLAEINKFHIDMKDDFKEMMKTFLAHQIDFYKNLTEKLESAMDAFDTVN